MYCGKMCPLVQVTVQAVFHFHSMSRKMGLMTCQWQTVMFYRDFSRQFLKNHRKTFMISNELFFEVHISEVENKSSKHETTVYHVTKPCSWQVYMLMHQTLNAGSICSVPSSKWSEMYETGHRHDKKSQQVARACATKSMAYTLAILSLCFLHLWSHREFMEKFNMTNCQKEFNEKWKLFSINSSKTFRCPCTTKMTHISHHNKY